MRVARPTEFRVIGRTTGIEAGKLVPSIDRTYPLEEAPLAVRQLEAGQIRGKVAIIVD